MLAMAMVVSLLPMNILTVHAAEPVKYGDFLVTTDVENGCSFNSNEKTLTISQSGKYTVSSQNNRTDNQIVVDAENVTLILSGIQVEAKKPLTTNYDVAIRAEGTVQLETTSNSSLAYACINLAAGKTLTFLGGTMSVTGISDKSYNPEGMPGIKGNLVMLDGTMTVKGGDAYDASSLISAGPGGSGIFGNVTVKGGSLKTVGGNGGYGAIGGNGGSGIYGLVTVYDGNVIATGGEGGNGSSEGSGNGGYGISGTLIAQGGKVTATGGDGGNNYSQTKCGTGGYGVGNEWKPDVAAQITLATVIAIGGTNVKGENSSAFQVEPVTASAEDRQTIIWAGANSGSASIVSGYANERYAKYEVVKGYAINYSGLESAVCENKPNVHKAGEATSIPNATKTGYTFDGWIINGSGAPVKDLTLKADTYTSTINLEAQWTINQYTITFDTDGGTDIAPITQDYNTAVTAPADPTKIGYIFDGWGPDIPTTIPAENVTIRALWTKCNHENNTNENYTFEDTTHSVICSLCQETVTNEHTGGTATCTDKAVCSVCKNTYGSVNKDNHVEYEYAAQENIITVSCTSCDYSGAFTLKAPEDLVYDATQKRASVDGTVPKITAPEITYEGDCTKVGTHKASITLTAGGNTYEADLSFDITAASIKNAEVSASNAVYDGTAHTPTVTVKLNNKTLTENTDYKVVSYSDNINAGTAKIEIEGIGNYKDTVFGSFIIEQIDGAVTNISDISKTYDGEAVANPTYTSLSKGNAIFEYKVKGADDSTYITNAPSDVGEYIVRVTVAADTNYKEASNTAEFTIAQKEIGISWGATEFLPYTGKIIMPKATATGLVNGDVCTLTTSVVETTDGAGIIPGRWHTKITALSNDNYCLPTSGNLLEIEYGIVKGYQDAPVVTGIDETIKGKADGKISGLTTEMEYAVEYTADDDKYTKVTDVNMTFAPGTYYVRYQEAGYYNASAFKEVIISAGNKIKVNIPETQNGYTLTVDETEVSWEESATLTFALKDGYSKTDGFTVKVNNKAVTLDADGKYVISNIQENQTITVEGVVDITAPTVEIQVKENKWNSFFNGLTFGLFFKETQKVTITAADVNTGSGIDKVHYYLSETEIGEADIASVTDWIEYKELFNIDPDNEYIIYAKATDKAGNTVYINSNGLVLDATAPKITGIENNGTYYGNTEFGVTERYLDTLTLDGETITLTNGKYTITADDKEHTIVAKDLVGNSKVVKITIKTVEALKNEINNLPSTVKPDDVETVEQIKVLKDAYDGLAEHEKTLISEEEKAKLESLLSQAVAYKIVEGNGASIREDSNGVLRFKANGAYSKFTGIKVDNNVIDVKYYTAESGSTIITLKNAFLDKLSVGTHSITVMYTDGEAKGNFKITAKPATPSDDEEIEGTGEASSAASSQASGTQVQGLPPTGDDTNLALYITTLLLASISLILLKALPRRRR